MKNPKTERIIYSISVVDLQEVSQKVLERRLTEREIDQVKGQWATILTGFKQ